MLATLRGDSYQRGRVDLPVLAGHPLARPVKATCRRYVRETSTLARRLRRLSVHSAPLARCVSDEHADIATEALEVHRGRTLGCGIRVEWQERVRLGRPVHGFIDLRRPWPKRLLSTRVSHGGPLSHRFRATDSSRAARPCVSLIILIVTPPKSPSLSPSRAPTSSTRTVLGVTWPSPGPRYFNPCRDTPSCGHKCHSHRGNAPC